MIIMNCWNSFIQGLGVAFGIIVGTAATVLVGIYQRNHKDKQQTRNLRFELELNVKKLK